MQLMIPGINKRTYFYLISPDYNQGHVHMTSNRVIFATFFAAHTMGIF